MYTFWCLCRHFSKNGGDKLIVWTDSSLLSEVKRLCKCFRQESKLPTLTYSYANSVMIKNAIMLNIIHNIFDLRDTEVIIQCMYKKSLKIPKG